MRNLFSVTLALVLAAGAAHAAVVIVDGRASGGFGFDYRSDEFDPFEPLVQGPELRAGQRVQISATGEIDGDIFDVNPGVFPPDGIPFTFVPDLAQTPLDEARGIQYSSSVTDGGALMAIFVPTTDASGKPWSENAARGDPTELGDLPASGLFFVGSSLSYTASSEGRLFFGINDNRPGNNLGAFEVTISNVPLPATGVVFLGGLATVFAFARTRRKKALSTLNE